MNDGTKGTFTHPSLTRMGAMTGTVEEGLFIPDEGHHDELFRLYGVEGESGLFLEQGTFTPAK